MTVLKKKAKRLVAMCLTLLLASTAITANAASFSLRWSQGMPTSDQRLVSETDLISDGTGRIRYYVSTYNAVISGAYAQTQTTPESNRIILDGTGTFRSQYSGTVVPKKGVRVKVTLRLQNYSDKKSVIMSGTIDG